MNDFRTTAKKQQSKVHDWMNLFHTLLHVMPHLLRVSEFVYSTVETAVVYQ